MSGMASISIRKSIRWGENPAGENASVLVLTSRAKTYVDVRVYASGYADDKLPNDPDDALAAERLEWAFAGQAQSTSAEYDGEKLVKPAHTVWSHWVDSKTLEEVKDEGDMVLQADGTVLETGAMAHPDTGIITAYEEVWEDLEPERTGDDEKHVSYVLRLDDPTTQSRGMVVRIGGHIQGVLRSGDQITAIRWRWVPETADARKGAWTRTLAIGTGQIPSGDSSEGGNLDGPLICGSVVVSKDGLSWSCIEAFSW